MGLVVAFKRHLVKVIVVVVLRGTAASRCMPTKPAQECGMALSFMWCMGEGAGYDACLEMR